MEPSAQKARVTQLILKNLDQQLGPGNYEPTAPFMDMGIDSLGAVSFQKNMQSAVGSGAKMTASVMFDYPTVASLVDYILESFELTGGDAHINHFPCRTNWI